MSSYIGLLRGINVGGKNKIPMADLRALFESLGHTDVHTLIQSGNVIFTSDQKVMPNELEIAIGARFGFEVAVVLRTPNALKNVLRNNPLAGVDPSNLHVGFMRQKPSGTGLSRHDKERFLPERYAVVGTELYLYLPDGMARTKLPDYLNRQLKVPITVRNWNTVRRLVDLAAT